MNRTALLLPLALLGMTSTAFAGIDDVAASMLDGAEADVAQTEDREERTTTTSTRSRGNKTATRQTASSGNKQVSRTTYSNGNKSHTKTRGRSRSTSSQSAYGANGDKHHSRDTHVKVRGSNKTTNGTKTVTQRRGANKHITERGGVQNGERYHHKSGNGTVRTSNSAHNSRTGKTASKATRTTKSGAKGGQGGVKTIDHRSTSHSTRTTGNQRPNRNLAVPGNRRPNISTRSGTVRSAPARPGSSVRPSSPSRTTVVTRPSTRTTRVTTTSRPRTTTVSRRVVTYRTVRPYHGVFVYGPAPTHHHHYHSSGPAQVRTKHMPDRAVDRANSVAVGLKMGSLASGYFDGGVYGDLGVGLAGRYRPAESVGLQMDLTHHAQSWGADTERSQTLAAGSVQLFAFPWTRVSPYALGGVTYDARNIQDDIYTGDSSATVIANDSLWGLHGGLGVELAMGQNLALDFEGRYIGYLDKSPTDPSLPGAFQFTGGLMVHF